MDNSSDHEISFKSAMRGDTCLIVDGYDFKFLRKSRHPLDENFEDCE